MKRVVLVTVMVLAVASMASAQSFGLVYVRGVTGASVGKAGSPLLGAEVGTEIFPGVDVFAELGYIPDLPTATRNGDATIIATALASKLGQTTSFTAKTRTVYAAAGAKYKFAERASLTPYVAAAGGIARVKQDVKFSVAGTDVTGRLADLGVTLGTDLAGSHVKPTVGVGVGVLRPWHGWDFDGGYRYTRIFTDVKGTNGHRLYIEAGKKF